MPPELESQSLPSAPVIPADVPGITEEAAAGKISDLLFPKKPRAPDGKFQSANPQPVVAEAAPEVEEPTEEAAPDEAAPAEDDIEIETDEDAEQTNAPSVDMPESWGKTAEAIWSALPPEAQTFLRQHETKRTQGISRQLNELKAEQEKVSQASQAIEQERLQLSRAAERYASETVKQFKAKFGDVKDVQKLSEDNPARFVQMQAAWSAVQAAQYEAEQLQAAQREKLAKQVQDFRTEENQKLAEAAGLKDEASATAFEKSIMDFTGQVGIPAERVGQYRADELLIVRDAMRYRAAVAKKAAAMKAQNPPPRVLKPGAPSSGKSLAIEAKTLQLSKNLRKTGSTDDAAAIIKARLFRK